MCIIGIIAGVTTVIDDIKGNEYYIIPMDIGIYF